MSSCHSQYMFSHSLRQQAVALDLYLWVPVCVITCDKGGAQNGSRML